jgi:hypothetical protein
MYYYKVGKLETTNLKEAIKAATEKKADLVYVTNGKEELIMKDGIYCGTWKDVPEQIVTGNYKQ